MNLCNKELKDTIEQLSLKLSEIESGKVKLEEEYNALEQLADLEKQYAPLNDQHDNLKQVNVNLIERLKRKSDAAAESPQKSEKKNAIENEVKAAEEEVLKLEESLAKAQQMNANLNQNLASWNNANMELERYISQAQELNLSLSKDLNKSEMIDVQMVKSVESDIEQLKAKNLKLVEKMELQQSDAVKAAECKFNEME